MDSGLKNGIEIQWCWIYLLSFVPLTIFAIDWFLAGWRLSQHNIWLLIIGILLVASGILKPIYIRFGSFEADMKKYAMSAERAAKKSDESARLATETVAVAVWNMNKLGSVSNAEDIATELLKQEYGDKAEDVKHFLQREGILLTPQQELQMLPAVSLDKEDIPEIYKIREKSREDDGS